MQSQGPSVGRFTYVYVPCDDAVAPNEITFDGSSDDELRDRLRRFFAKGTYTDGAKAELRTALLAKVDEDKRANVDPRMLEGLVGDEGQFEIVPIVLPSRANGFTAISLYIDDKGRFKDLPLNSRASKIAQRDIRGDGFLLSNHDDPALDTWERVDTTIATFERLLANPPSTTLNTADQGQMAAAAAARDSDTVVVSAEAAAEALQLRANGNEAVAAGDFTQAAGMYGAASEKLRGRTDLLENSKECEAARVACLLNLSFCGLKLQHWQMAAGAAAQALVFAPDSQKGWFRLATAQVNMGDYDEAERAIARCAEHGVPAEDVAALRAALADGQ
eukprot:CAMPEP_0174861508 /NCGR_PEP_ID=MMETSP1114-20130205/51794_1 /TAXON_ID=312471 /ORGANISM="Neobodo designis, Strain CCAP 1951/1" /LENGTH=332 /DNA_ID=CAMNT_0016096521 /DNA_START=51 /DNA_END=1046 /DNA_ORIENTATION=+